MKEFSFYKILKFLIFVLKRSQIQCQLGIILNLAKISKKVYFLLNFEIKKNAHFNFHKFSYKASSIREPKFKILLAHKKLYE